MNEKYIISVKSTKDTMGNPCEKWEYAGIDDGSYGSGYPCWCFSEYSGKSFSKVEDAKKWFDLCKSHLLEEHYINKYGLDMSTLAIRKVIYKSVMPLNA